MFNPVIDTSLDEAPVKISIYHTSLIAGEKPVHSDRMRDLGRDPHLQVQHHLIPQWSQVQPGSMLYELDCHKI